MWIWVFKLVRWPNLLIVAATQWLIYFYLLHPIFDNHTLTGSFTLPEFILFVITTSLITASGYIINDLFDIETDKINRPHQRIIDLHISRSSARIIYFTFLIIGAFISLFLAMQRGDLAYWLIYPLANIVLFSYSKWFKGIPLLGNIIVSIYCGAVPGLFFLTEKSAFALLKPMNNYQFDKVIILLFSYTIFAFSTNLYREIVKDLQDEPGDYLSNIPTAAVLWGIPQTKYIALFVALSTLLYINYTFNQYYFTHIPYLFYVRLILVQLPLFMSILYLIRAKNAIAFKKVGIWIKLIMMNGLILLAYITYYQNG
jgi:4-hydroxybenzoate polyprenyltransferase